MESAVFLSGATVAVGMLLITNHSSASLRYDLPLASVTQEIHVHVLLAHQGVLEVVGGDTRVDPETAVLDNLDHANLDCRTLLVGSDTDSGWVAPLVNPTRTGLAIELGDGVKAYRGWS